MKKGEKRQKFGFFFKSLTECKRHVKQIMQNVKNSAKKPHTSENRRRPVAKREQKKAIIKIRKKTKRGMDDEKGKRPWPG
ncbi:MAG: hypothetical protein ACLVB5_13045 [Christensenellales bacterium]